MVTRAKVASEIDDPTVYILGDVPDQTIAMVREFYGLLESLQREVPGFQNDVDLATDADMLGEFLALLDTSALQGTEPRQVLADSLQLSGYFKTVPRSDSEPWDWRR